MRTDVAVIGLGAMGAATLYQLARRGIRAIGIDRYHPPHDLGSSHGETRITRCAVGEGEELVPLALRSHAIWRELEAETGEALLDACGFLMMAPQGLRTGHHGKQDFLRRTVAAAERHGIPHKRLDTAALALRFPAFVLRREEGYFEPGGGYVRPERCIAAQLGRAEALGATIRTGHTVLRVEQSGPGVRIDMAGEALTADRVVVAAGAWAADLLGPAFTDLLVPRRQTLHWFPTKDEASFASGTCPAYIWMYGSRPVTWVENMAARSAGKTMRGAVSPCSGHGFKHSAAIGEAIAELLHAGRSMVDLEPFRLSRLRSLPAAAD